MQAPPQVAKSRRLLMCTTALSLLVNAGVAQQTSAPQAEETDDSKETIVLSPFVVDSSEDEGYRASATLAGSRIKTNLKDVAAPITVVTKEFFADLGATDINDVLAYTAGTEGTRDFTASTVSLGRPTDAIAANAFSANRVRGLESPQITRDYFHTINDWIGFDTYNLDDLTISRGPNSILAGLGSAAGVINYSPQLAQLARNRTSVSLRIGSHSDLRTVLNTNYVVKKDVLAFRFAGLFADRGFDQQPAYNKDRRIYFTTTYKPWSRTTLRASYEYAHVRANNPNTITPEDGITQWLQLGSPVYDMNQTGSTVPAPLTAGGNGAIAVYNSDGALEGWYRSNTRATFYQGNLGNVPLWTASRMNSNRYLDLHELNLNPSRDDRHYEAFNVSIDQEILPRLYANVSYVDESVNSKRLNLFRSEFATIFVDPNVRLPNGAPNPHFGETYMQFRGLDNRGTDNNTNEILRGTLSYDLDLKDVNKWLGRYRITGFMEGRETEFHDRQWNAKVASDIGAFEDYSYRYYLGGSATAKTTRVPGMPSLVSGAQGIPPGYESLPSGATTLTGVYALKSDRKRYEELDSAAVVLQAYLWDDKIVGTFGRRRDSNKAAEAIGGGGPGGGPINPAGDYSAPAKYAQYTDSYGAVVHPLSWLSVHYNKSENFRPNAGKVDLLNNPTPAPTGEGEDYGFTVELLEGKLRAKVNWFKLTAAGAPAESVTFPLNQWTIPFLELTVMPQIASTAAFQAANPNFVYKKRMAEGLTTGDQRLNGGYTADRVSKGMELEVTYNVTKNWRVMASVTKQEAKQSNIAASLTEFIEERLQYWQSSGLFNYQVPPGGGWGQTLTGREYWERDSLAAYLRYRSAEGRPSDQLAEWHASAMTNYSFTEGLFKGFNIGMGGRFIEGSVIGHPAILDSAGRVIGLDLDRPYKNSSYIAVDAWIGYRRKIFADRYNLILQLNVRDLQESGHFRPIMASADGNHSAYRIMQPRTFYLNTTLEF
jgi:outer membrane receptor protein involved in Fe transport